MKRLEPSFANRWPKSPVSGFFDVATRETITVIPVAKDGTPVNPESYGVRVSHCEGRL